MTYTNAHGMLPFSMLFIVTLLGSRADAGDTDMSPHETYRGNHEKFTLQLPPGWHVRDQAPGADVGVVAFFSQPVEITLDKDPEISRRQQETLVQLVADIESGAVPSFFVDRYKAGKGMSCEGFDARAVKKKVKILTSAGALGRKPAVIGEPQVATTDFGGCRGLRVMLHARNDSGELMQMLVYSAAQGGVTYDLVLLTHADYFDRNLPWFEQVAGSLRLAGARLTASN